jgi:uncharacterized protein YidB (DUF937 family)
MAKRMPSLAALLGLLALAGYSNRDKIGEFIKTATKEGGAFDQAKKQFGEATAGTTIGKSLDEMVKQFDKNGEGDKPKSWIETGPNKEITEPQLDKAAGPDFIDELAKQAGLTRDELLTRLRQVLPEAVDKLTPEGKIPA